MRRIRLIDILDPQLVVPRMAAETKLEAIEELLDRLIAEGKVPAARRDYCLRALLKREDSQSTGLQLGVAVPHCEVEGLDRLVGCMGFKPGGVDFDSLDGRPARIFIMLLVPSNYIQAHVRTLAGIARLLNERRLRRALLEARDGAQVLELLREAEGQLRPL